MKLKTLMAIGIVLSVALIAGMGFGLVHLSRRYQQSFDTLELAEQINTTIGQIGILTTDYVLHPQSSKSVLWQSHQKTLMTLLNKGERQLAEPEFKILLSEGDKALSLFRRTLNSHRTSNLANPLALDVTNVERAIIDQLQAHIRIMASHAANLLAHTETYFQDSVDQMRKLMIVMLLALPILIASLWIIIALRVIPAIRFMSTTLPKLADDPEFRIAMSRKDEIGELAKNFNTLAARLQNTRVSRNELAAEVATRMCSERALQKSEAQLRLAASVFEHSTEAIVIADDDNQIIDVNRAFTKTHGYKKQEVLGYTFDQLNSERHDKNFHHEQQRSLNSTGQWQGELWNRRKDGTDIPELGTINRIDDDQGKVTNYIGIFTDISEIKNSQQQLHQLAHHDPLTGLPNRLLLDERLAWAIKSAGRHRTGLTLVFLDLDNFKQINDAFGHPVGDKILQSTANRLTSALRENDTVARLGGDEFVLLLEDVNDRSHIIATIEKIRSALGKPVVVGNQILITKSSIGISMYPDDGNDAETLIRNADIAMYHAKTQGRNRFVFYDAALEHPDQTAMNQATKSNKRN